MAQRFTIEEIEIQDTSGVIFRALDSTTGGVVAVRRFFPFGPTGGGLTADEQEEYASALQHLETVEHPTLRTIVDGGCDPVDGIPFIATEWLNGVSLRHILASRPLTRLETTTVLIHALEACEALSTVLGREGVWIETDPQTIIIGAEETHRPVTFWISPLRWLGQMSGQKGMEPLVVLTEVAMGWSGEPADSHGASGLAGWLKWLREADRSVSLAEARERLTASVGRESGPASHRPAHQTAQVKPAAGKLKTKSKAPAWILACSFLIAAGLAGWILIQKNRRQLVDAGDTQVPRMESQSTAVAMENPDASEEAPDEIYAPRMVASNPRERSVEAVNRQFEDRMAKARAADESLEKRREAVRDRGDVYLPDDGDLLLEVKKGTLVKIEGKLEKVHSTKAGNIYLSFSETTGGHIPRAYVMEDDVTPELTEDNLKLLEDRTIRMEGLLRIYGNRPEVRIEVRSAITEP